MGDSEFDELKAHTNERHSRGTKRFQQRRDNLEEKRKRGGPRVRRPRHDEPDELGLDFADDDLSPPGSHRDPSKHASVHARRDNPDGHDARVVEVARTEVRVRDQDGTERACKLVPGVLAAGGVVVGDDVVVDPLGRIVARGERRTILERRAPGQRHRTKLLAANVDAALITLAPRARGLSLGFLDRAAAAVRGGGIEPIVVVTKMDLVESEDERIAIVAELQPWTRIGGRSHAVSSTTGEGLEQLREELAGHVTVLLGHSGAGKSTLINALDPDAGRVTGEVRAEDGRGRHTTTASRLIPFLRGGALVDTPGIRELVPNLTGTDSLLATIPELAGLAGQCRFPNCRHGSDAGCAIAKAAASDPSVAGALRRYQRLLESLD